MKEEHEEKEEQEENGHRPRSSRIGSCSSCIRLSRLCPLGRRQPPLSSRTLTPLAGESFGGTRDDSTVWLWN